MLFTGNFFRMASSGYKMNDKTMTERTLARADFASIRRNQDALIKSGKIEAEEETKIAQKETTAVTQIDIKNTESILNLKNPWENPLLKKNEAKDIKISILKTIFSNDYIAILGALGAENKTVKVYNDKTLMGSYKTIKSFTGDQFQKFKNVNGISEFDLYAFVKKL